MARRGLPQGRSGHRVAFFAGAAALGAVGFGLAFPAGPVQAVTTEASSQMAITSQGGEVSPQAAAATPHAHARPHSIAEFPAQRTAAAQAAQAAAAAAA